MRWKFDSSVLSKFCNLRGSYIENGSVEIFFRRDGKRPARDARARRAQPDEAAGRRAQRRRPDYHRERVGIFSFIFFNNWTQLYQLIAEIGG